MGEDKQSLRLSIHHVGGRDGMGQFPVLEKFEGDIVNVLYEADPDCVEQIEERNRGRQSEDHVLPYCLGEAPGTAYLNINYDPYTSSLKETNPAYSSYYEFFSDHDYIRSDVTKTMEKRAVELVSIDHIFQHRLVLVPPPDFLSIDTEGSEHEILRGAQRTLASSVLAVVVEFQFQPLFEDQKLLGDLTDLLSSQGFHFVKILGLPSEMAPSRAPVGLRAEGFQYGGDALYLRRIESILDGPTDGEPARHAKLQKLAFIAIVYNQLEYALQCLRESKALAVDGVGVTASEQPSYCKFLGELEERVEHVTPVYPRTFGEKHSFETSQARFEASPGPNGVSPSRKSGAAKAVSSIKKLLRLVPFLSFSVRGLRKLRGRVKKVVHAIEVKAFRDHSAVEELLIRYGLEDQAQVLRKNRLHQSRFCEKAR